MKKKNRFQMATLLLVVTGGCSGPEAARHATHDQISIAQRRLGALSACDNGLSRSTPPDGESSMANQTCLDGGMIHGEWIHPTTLNSGDSESLIGDSEPAEPTEPENQTTATGESDVPPETPETPRLRDPGTSVSPSLPDVISSPSDLVHQQLSHVPVKTIPISPIDQGQSNEKSIYTVSRPISPILISSDKPSAPAVTMTDFDPAEPNADGNP